MLYGFVACHLLSVVSYQENLVIHMKCRANGFFGELGIGKSENSHLLPLLTDSSLHSE